MISDGRSIFGFTFKKESDDVAVVTKVGKINSGITVGDKFTSISGDSVKNKTLEELINQVKYKSTITLEGEFTPIKTQQVTTDGYQFNGIREYNPVTDEKFTHDITLDKVDGKFGFGFTRAREGSLYFVAQVKKDGPAYSKLKPRDFILEINNEPIKNLDKKQVVALINTNSKPTLRVVQYWKKEKY